MKNFYFTKYSQMEYIYYSLWSYNRLSSTQDNWLHGWCTVSTVYNPLFECMHVTGHKKIIFLGRSLPGNRFIGKIWGAITTSCIRAFPYQKNVKDKTMPVIKVSGQWSSKDVEENNSPAVFLVNNFSWIKENKGNWCVFVVLFTKQLQHNNSWLF